MNLCINAVSTGKAYLEAKKQIALQRKNTGDISETAYGSLLQTLNEQAQWVTLDTCMASQGAQTSFFQCLVNQAGNINQCNK